MLKLVSTNEQLYSCLPESMKGKLLNNLPMPHFHKDKIGRMDLLEVTNNFVELRDNRCQIYNCYDTSNTKEIVSVKM